MFVQEETVYVAIEKFEAGGGGFVSIAGSH
jgi:hypothetical protein